MSNPKMFSRLLPMIVGFLFVGLLSVGCKTANETASNGGGSTDTKSSGGSDQILIGQYAPMTGTTATFGVETNNGVMLAEKEINASGGVLGKKIHVETQDDQSKQEEAATVVTKFKDESGIVAVIGEVASSRTKAAAPVLQDAGIPMVSSASTNPDVTKVGDYIFRVCYTDTFQGYAMAKFAHDNLKFTKVAIMRDQKNDYSIGLANVFADSFKKMGGQIVIDNSYKEGDSDFRSQLSEIKKTAPEAIFVPGYYGEVGPIARQARELGIMVPFLGGDGWDSPQLVTGAGGPGKALEGSYFLNHYSKDDTSKRSKTFVEAYKAEYKTDPSGLAALGYDALKVVADAITRAGTTDHKAVRDALASTKKFPGVSGDITIDAERNARKPIVVLQIKGNAFVMKASIQPLSEAKSSMAPVRVAHR